MCLTTKTGRRPARIGRTESPSYFVMDTGRGRVLQNLRVSSMQLFLDDAFLEATSLVSLAPPLLGCPFNKSLSAGPAVAIVFCVFGPGWGPVCGVSLPLAVHAFISNSGVSLSDSPSLPDPDDKDIMLAMDRIQPCQHHANLR